MNINERQISRNIELITEKFSISNDVANAADQIYKDVSNEYAKCLYKKLQDGLYYREGQKDYDFWGHHLKVVFCIYDFTDQRVFDDIVDDIDFENEFNRKSMTMTISVVTLFGMVYKESTEDNVYHEMEHFYQWCMKKNTNPQWEALDNLAYSYANVNLQTSSDNIVRMIAWIVYYSKPSEQDAFAHEYYVQSRNSMDNFRKRNTVIEQRFDYYKHLVKWLNENYNDPNVQFRLNQYRQYGYTPKNILTYANKGIKRFKEKIEHVRKLINITNKEIMPFNKKEIEETVRKIVNQWTKENA
ncbi:MAG: hypothetical protein LUD72_05305 [Bacteroidales bacterium]|nr:hypothetical protein [Bacteroidales bacterium]